ncbi:SH3 domain-containing protein [Streptomyces zingiberis]|uniref:SH3 domain-containing protein n=1 Tax=Streptomyces zingiberis TaxID=2053010 RepID=A0ABX1BYV6_9ACTN|nr:SH3 domain-containing protein [Streptomyces zingiberis]NJQ01655.1 SH3 domain-containing protein [Streptomyces zingiberis]
MFNSLKSRGAGLAAGAAASALLVGGSLLGAAPVQADPHHPEEPVGKVTASVLNHRQYPSTDSSVVGQSDRGDHIPIKCKVRAQLIEGDPIWYLARHGEFWVSGRYVEVRAKVKWCKDVHHGPPAEKETGTAKG